MAIKKPNIIFFLWDNFAWGELGCYGGGVLRGAQKVSGAGAWRCYPDRMKKRNREG